LSELGAFNDTNRLTTCECEKTQVNEMYLIICNNKPDKVVQECCRREQGELRPDFIKRIVSRCVIPRKLVFRSPMIIYDCLVVLLSVTLEKMLLEVRVPGVFLVEVIGNVPWELEPINDAMSFAASLLEGGVAIRKAVLTCITCKFYSFP